MSAPWAVTGWPSRWRWVAPAGGSTSAPTLPLDDPSYPSLALLVPAAHWDEREAQDLLGIVAGRPSRPATPRAP